MLKKAHVLSWAMLFAVLSVSFVPRAMADGSYGMRVTKKFDRGMANTLTGWLELPKNIFNTSNQHNIVVGLTWGCLKGMVYTVGRTAVGVVELTTFFIPNKEIVHPTYAWSGFFNGLMADYNRDTSFGGQNNSFSEGVGRSAEPNRSP